MTIKLASSAPLLQKVSSAHTVNTDPISTRTVLLRPQFEPLAILIVHLHPFVRHALEDVVDLALGDIEYCGMTFRDEPSGRHHI